MLYFTSHLYWQERILDQRLTLLIAPCAVTAAAAAAADVVLLPCGLSFKLLMALAVHLATT